MKYSDSLVKKARTIETLEIFDIMEIVINDLKRYNVPDRIIMEFVAKHVVPLKKESELIKYKFSND